MKYKPTQGEVDNATSTSTHLRQMTVDFAELTKHDLYLTYLAGVKSDNFVGSFTTYKELVRTGRIETERA